MRNSRLLWLVVPVALGITACLHNDDDPAAVVSTDVPYHVLLSSWGIGETNGDTEYVYGWRLADVPGANVSDPQVVLANDCSLQIISPSSDSLSTLASGCTGETTLAASLSGDQIVMSFPETTVGGDTVGAWESRLNAVGASRTHQLPDVAGGIATIETSLASGAGERVEVVPAFMARKSTNASIQDLVGDWGLVRLEDENTRGSFANNLYIVGSVSLSITAEDGGRAVSRAEFVDGEYSQRFDGTPAEKRHLNRSPVDFSIPIAVSPTGVVTVTNPPRTRQPAGESNQILEGFMSPAGDLIVFAEGVPTIKQVREDAVTPGAGEDGFAAHQLNIFIRRDVEPQLAGREYRLVGVHFRINAEGLEMRSWQDDATVSFGLDGSGEWLWNESTYRVNLDGSSSGGVLRGVNESTVSFDYSVESDGRIVLDLSGEPGIEQAIVSGFSQVGGGMLVFMHAISYGDTTEGEIGMWFAYPK